MHSYYMPGMLAADRQQQLLRDARSHRLAAEPRQPWTLQLSSWWAAERRRGRLRGRAAVLASATVAAG